MSYSRSAAGELRATLFEDPPRVCQSDEGHALGDAIELALKRFLQPFSPVLSNFLIRNGTGDPFRCAISQDAIRHIGPTALELALQELARGPSVFPVALKRLRKSLEMSPV
jgi:hypothetical protein